MRYSITKETPWPSFCTEIQEPTVTGNGGTSVHAVHGVAGILNRDPVSPWRWLSRLPWGTNTSNASEIAAWTALPRDRPKAHHVQGDVDLQMVMLYLNV